MSGELKPCPVCGNRAFLSITGVPGHRSVWCLTDGCLRMPPRETAEEAAAAWNTRAELSSLRGEAVAWMYERGAPFPVRYIHDMRTPAYLTDGEGWTETPLYARPTPDSDVIGRLVGALDDTQATLSAVKAEATVDGGGTCVWIAETLHAQMVTIAVALASLPSAVKKP